MAPRDAVWASLGGLNLGRRTQMPPSPWVPKLWGPVCILTPAPNIRAPIRLRGERWAPGSWRGQLGLEDGAG